MLSHPKNPKIDCSDQEKLSTREYIIKRLRSELQGICSCVASDHVITIDEANFLLSWLEQHQALLRYPIAATLLETLQNAVQDNKIDDAELRILLSQLKEISASGLSDRIAKVAGMIEYDELPEEVTADDFIGVELYITGAMLSNERSKVCTYLRKHNVNANENFTKSIRYLVVGALGHRGWPEKNMSKLITVLRERNNPKRKLYGCKIINESKPIRIFPDIPFQLKEYDSNQKKSQKTSTAVQQTLLRYLDPTG